MPKRAKYLSDNIMLKQDRQQSCRIFERDHRRDEPLASRGMESWQDRQTLLPMFHRIAFARDHFSKNKSKKQRFVF